MFDLTCEKNRFAAVAKNQNGEDVLFDLYYRRPTTEEVVAYNAKLMLRKNGKIVTNVIPTRIDFGLRILLGFQDGIFQANGKGVSSDPESPDYFPDWKGLLKSVLPGTVAEFGFRIFEFTKDGSAMIEEPDDSGEGREEIPLA